MGLFHFKSRKFPTNHITSGPELPGMPETEKFNEQPYNSAWASEDRMRGWERSRTLRIEVRLWVRKSRTGRENPSRLVWQSLLGLTKETKMINFTEWWKMTTASILLSAQRERENWLRSGCNDHLNINFKLTFKNSYQVNQKQSQPMAKNGKGHKTWGQTMLCPFFLRINML